MNVIVTQAEGDGFVTLYPCDSKVPDSSAVNYSPAGESTNMVVVDLSSTGEICVYALARRPTSSSTCSACSRSTTVSWSRA